MLPRNSLTRATAASAPLPVHATIVRRADRQTAKTMKIRNSIRSLRERHRDNRIVRRRGRIYIINKKNPRFKARQG